MYERMVTLLEEAQTIWSLASSWLAGLRKWFDDPNTNRISFEGGTMTDGVSPGTIHFAFGHRLTLKQQDPQPHALLHPPTSTSAWQNKMAQNYAISSGWELTTIFALSMLVSTPLF